MPLFHDLLHPLATASASSANPSTKAIRSAIPTSLDRGFPLLQTHLPLALSQQAAKVLRKLEHHSDGRIALDELLQIGRLLSCAALGGPHHQKRNASGRRGIVQDDGLFRDGTFSRLAKCLKLPAKGALRTRVSLNDNLLIQQGRVVAALVPS